MCQHMNPATSKVSGCGLFVFYPKTWNCSKIDQLRPVGTVSHSCTIRPLPAQNSRLRSKKCCYDSSMRNDTFTLILNHADISDVITSIHPISRGPYAGHDVLVLMDDLCGRAYVIRQTLDGKQISKTEKVFGKDGMALVTKLLNGQSDKDCDAVTGGGRWGCE